VARGFAPPPFDAVIRSTVPLGGGLSSSAALEVATATLLESMLGKLLEPIQKALLCQEAEHKFAGVPCGIMDQFSSTLCTADHLMLLDCRSQEVQLVPFTDPDITVLITNSNVKHELTGGEYAQRRAQCEAAAKTLGVATLRDANAKQLESARGQLGDVNYRRARHVIGEIDRTVRAANAIQAGRWSEVGQLMYASHDSLRDDYEVSCKELDLLVDIAREMGERGGVIGSRMTGGGFGGCTVSLVRTGSAAAVAKTLHDRYREQTGIEPTLFTSRPGRGAHVIGAK
jgi:galactokinase